ncbi:hypothetical protein AKJ64_02230 [candidate division MSBL1 archaeon SCGC-AAA259E17]|uniref:Uncharacterized protein n=1 Tax=candidate division MSBL1 archaeon SCGC-AAA259E17 TaxID=1698263 RepID=A0A133UEZ0_9EURY|nr:hypothetical protein AKJ64_02230 [candidate division MSBL1 archaeon SCGC-AAA259E17]
MVKRLCRIAVANDAVSLLSSLRCGIFLPNLSLSAPKKEHSGLLKKSVDVIEIEDEKALVLKDKVAKEEAWTGGNR